MSERITRINDCKIELGRCTDEELYRMAEEAILRVQVAEMEVANISQELRRRNHEVVMGEPDILAEC